MANMTKTNFYPVDGVRGVQQSEQKIHTNDTGVALTVYRLTILGKILSVIGTSTANAGNTGNGTLTLFALANSADGKSAKVGSWLVTCVDAGAAHGGSFAVTDPDGVLIGTIIMPEGAGGTYAFEGGGISFTLTDGGTNFVTGDYFTLTITAGTGYYKQYAAAAVDGSQIIAGISLSEVIHTADGDLAIGVMTQGEVEKGELILHGNLAGVGITDKIMDEMKAIGIIVTPITECNALDNQS